MSKYNTVKNSIALKLLAMAVLSVLLLIPTVFIMVLIEDRANTQEQAIAEVSSKWADMQTITGLILSIPYKTYLKNTEGETTEEIKYAHFLPDELNIAGVITPQTLSRDIYEVVVYNAKLKINGKFFAPNFNNYSIASENIIWPDAFISLGIPDMKGLEENIALNWNGSDYKFNPGIKTNDVLDSGVSIKVPVGNYENNFSLELNLNGSQKLNFIPLGRETNLQLTSNWANPSFQGAFLPDEREVSESGFSANWKVLHLNRNYPQQWLGSASPSVKNSAFGVELLIPVDQYQKTTRSIKYAIMLIALTFLIFFFVEVLNKKRIHPIQYILVGLALCIFYLLLLSISEHLNFNQAYIISSIATILLITAYAKSVFKNNKLTLLQSLILVILYGFMYIIIQLEDYALIIGSIGLFVVLAIVMYISRKIDWYEIGSNEE